MALPKKKWVRSGLPRRTVKLCVGTKPGTKGKGGNSKLWAFGYSSLAGLLDMSELAVRKAVSRGDMSPADLKSVMEFYVQYVRKSETPSTT